MPVYKSDNGTWYVLTRYLDWKGERKQKCKRGFETRKELLRLQHCKGAGLSQSCNVLFRVVVSNTKVSGSVQRVPFQRRLFAPRRAHDIFAAELLKVS